MDGVMILKAIQHGIDHKYTTEQVLEISGGTVNSVFDRLRACGLIEKGGQQPARYSITEDGRKALEVVDFLEARRAKYPSNEELCRCFGSALIEKMKEAAVLEELELNVKVLKPDDPLEGKYLPLFDLGNLGKCVICGHTFAVGNGPRTVCTRCPQCCTMYRDKRGVTTIETALGSRAGAFGYLLMGGLLLAYGVSN